MSSLPTSTCSMTTRTDIYRDVQYSRMLAVLGLFIVFGTGVAVGAVYGAIVRLALWVFGALLLTWLLWRTRLTVVVDADKISVGSAHIAWSWVGGVEILDGDLMREALTTGAHPRDYMRIRNTSHGARIWLHDPSDPHRAWLFSVRDSAALRRVLAEREGTCDET